MADESAWQGDDYFVRREVFRRLMTCPAVAEMGRQKKDDRYPLTYCVKDPPCEEGCCFHCGKPRECVSRCLRSMIAGRK